MDPTGDAQSRSTADRGGRVDGSVSSSSSTTHEVEYDTVTRRARRGPGGWWWLALLAVPLLLALLATLIGRGGIQDELKTASTKVLEGQGIAGAQVDFSGRDGTVTLPDGADAASAKKILDGVDGIRVVDVQGGAAADGAAMTPSESAPASPSESTPSTAATAGAPFSLTNDGDTVVVEGTVPDAASKKAVIDAATAAAGDKKVTDKVTVQAGSPAPDVEHVTAGVGALPSGDGVTLDYDGTNVTLTGEVDDAAAKKAAGDQATAQFSGATVNNQLTVKGGDGAANAACAKINTDIEALLKSNEPRFGDNSATLVPSTGPTLDKVAAAIKGCPDAKVRVTGYTDNTGVESRNKTLSQQRANAVKAYLSGKGVDADAITARGYGEEDPIAPNTTEAGRDANRRVEITVQGG